MGVTHWQISETCYFTLKLSIVFYYDVTFDTAFAHEKSSFNTVYCWLP